MLSERNRHLHFQQKFQRIQRIVFDGQVQWRVSKHVLLVEVPPLGVDVVEDVDAVPGRRLVRCRASPTVLYREPTVVSLVQPDELLQVARFCGLERRKQSENQYRILYGDFSGRCEKDESRLKFFQTINIFKYNDL